MDRLTVVLPQLIRARGERAVAAWRQELLRGHRAGGWSYSLLVVDNAAPSTNRGVAASWNAGARMALEQGADWLLVVSEAVVPARRGMAALFDALADDGSPDVVGGLELGWKCAAIRLGVLLGVGLFDENYWPGYYEDTDYLYRMGLAGFDSPRENGRGHRHEPVRLLEPVEDAHAIRESGVRPDFEWLRGYYRRKWGGDQGAETFDHPFGEPSRGVEWWRLEPDAPVLREGGTDGMGGTSPTERSDDAGT